MNCPECGGRLSIYDSRLQKNNTTWRRLECTKCKKRYSSIEELQGDTRCEVANLQMVFKKLAKRCIISGGYTSSLTGGTYPTKEEAEKDTITELERIYNEQ